MAESVTIRFDATGVAGTVREFQKLESGLDKVRFATQRARTAGLALTAGLTVPLAAAAGAALKLAADAEETANLFQVSMGEMRAEADRFATSLAESLRIDPLTIKKTLGTFQSMLEGMGVGADRAFEMARGLARMQLDMASFFNLRPSEAFQKLQSAISGEIEPLRRLGFVTNQAKIEQVALQEGIAETGEELSATEKVVARWMALMQQARDRNILGDMSRTMDSMTNTARSLREQIGILGREIGETMIPVIKPLVSDLLNLVEGLNNASPTTKRLIVLLGGLSAAAGPVLVVLSQLVIAVTDVVATIAAAGGLTAAMSGLASVLTGPVGLIALLGAAGLTAVLVGLATTTEEVVLPATEKLQKAMDELTKSTEKLTGAQAEQKLGEVATQYANVHGQIVSLQEEIGGLEEQFQAGAAFGPPNLQLSADIDALREQKDALIQRAQILRNTIIELEGLLGGTAGAGGDDDDTAGQVSGIRFGAPVGLGTGAGLIGAHAQMQRRFRPIMTEAGTVMVDTLSDLREASAEGAESLQGIVNATGDGFNTIADVAITSMGQAVQAAITGFDNIAAIVINAVNQIIQSLGRQGGPLAGLLGGAGIPLIGAGLGIIGALVSGGGSDRQPPARTAGRWSA